MPQPRPLIPAKTYYLEIDGKPACCSPLKPLAAPTWRCGQGSYEEATQEALLVWRDHPGCSIAIKEGPCPRYLEEEADAMDYYERYDDAY